MYIKDFLHTAISFKVDKYEISLNYFEKREYVSNLVLSKSSAWK